MSIERAIIQLVVDEGAFGQTNDKVQADLTSTERAGKSAEASAAAAERGARSAERAATSLASKIPTLIRGLAKVASAASRFAQSAGFDESTTAGEAVGIGAAVAHGGARLAHAAATYNPVEAVLAVKDTIEQVDHVLTHAKELAAAHEDKRQDEVLDALFKEAGLDKLDQGRAPHGRR